MSNSDQHREKLDYFTAFAKEKIIKTTGGKIKKNELLETFKMWFNTNYGKGMPKGKEITEFMDKRYGVYNKGWHNVSIIYDEEEDFNM